MAIETSAAHNVDSAPHSLLKNVPTDDLTLEDESWQDNAWAHSYPSPPLNGGVTEIVFDTEVKDPWRALEDQDSEVTKKFIEEQNHVSLPLPPSCMYVESSLIELLTVVCPSPQQSPSSKGA